MKNQLLLMMLIILVSSGIIIYLFILGVKAPLQKLTKLTQQFSKGNYAVRSNYKSTSEVGILAGSFNHMASSVDQQYHELMEQSQKLELQKNELIEKNRELDSAKQKAESADRLKTSFLLNISHELRTPLNSIIGFSGILLKQLPGQLNEEQIRQVKMIQSSGRHLLSLINDILDISKIEAGELKPDLEVFDLNDLIEEIGRQFLPTAREKGVSLTWAQKPETGRIESDKKRLTQVLINLVNNAVKFTIKGSVSISCFRDADSVYIEVSDTGIGIKEGDLEYLFTPFNQLQNNLTRNFEGSGLGLSISRKLIEMLRGSISVKSGYGVGSTFSISLPGSLK